MSSEAFDELRELQADCANVTLEENADSWTYCWGLASFSSSQYYKFYFRNLEPHGYFLWLWKSKSTPRIKFFGWLL
jgi:hypothetical protein